MWRTVHLPTIIHTNQPSIVDIVGKYTISHGFLWVNWTRSWTNFAKKSVIWDCKSLALAPLMPRAPNKKPQHQQCHQSRCRCPEHRWRGSHYQGRWWTKQDTWKRSSAWISDVQLYWLVYRGPGFFTMVCLFIFPICFASPLNFANHRGFWSLLKWRFWCFRVLRISFWHDVIAMVGGLVHPFTQCQANKNMLPFLRPPPNVCFTWQFYIIYSGMQYAFKYNTKIIPIVLFLFGDILWEGRIPIISPLFMKISGHTPQCHHPQFLGETWLLYKVRPLPVVGLK